MGWKFRRGFQVLPGVRLNLGKKSAGLTFGGKLFRLTKSTSGRTTVGTSVPGTGLYYSKSVKGGSRRRSKASAARPVKWKTVAVVGAAFALIGCAASLSNRQSEPESVPAVRSVMPEDDQPAAAENATPAVLDHGLQARFDGIIDGAAVSATDNKATIETAFSSDAAPDNLEQIKTALAEATVEPYNGSPASVSVLASDGTILLSVGNGKVLYDFYKKQADAAAAAESPKQENQYDPLVYVSQSGKIHNDPSCSGMKSYTTMTLSEATGKGYELCEKCW